MILLFFYGVKVICVKDVGGQEDVDLCVMCVSEVVQFVCDGIMNVWREFGQLGGYIKSVVMFVNVRDIVVCVNVFEVMCQINYIEKYFFQGFFEKIIEVFVVTILIMLEKLKGKKV